MNGRMDRQTDVKMEVQTDTQKKERLHTDWETSVAYIVIGKDRVSGIKII
jgi:hypothetical protein